jgi:hypothetical protein
MRGQSHAWAVVVHCQLIHSSFPSSLAHQALFLD